MEILGTPGIRDWSPGAALGSFRTRALILLNLCVDLTLERLDLRANGDDFRIVSTVMIEKLVEVCLELGEGGDFITHFRVGRSDDLGSENRDGRLDCRALVRSGLSGCVDDVEVELNGPEL